MQINIMGWLTVGWAVAALAAQQRWGSRGLQAVAAMTGVLLIYNIASLIPLRGLDAAWQRSIEQIGREAPPARTVFVINDFDWFMVYASLSWGEAEPGVDRLGSAPQPEPVFKWIGVGSDLLRHPDRTADQHAEQLRGEIDRAFALGYDVLISQEWEFDRARFAATVGILNNHAHTDAMWRTLHEHYEAAPAFEDPLAGRYYRLREKP